MEETPSLVSCAVQQISDLAIITPKSLQEIKRLDNIGLKLSKKIDELSEIKNQNGDLIEEIKTLRSVLDLIYTKKISIAMNNYDLIDQNAKIIDMLIASNKCQDEQGHIPTAEVVSSQEQNVTEPHHSMAHANKFRRKFNSTATSSDLSSEKEPVYCVCRQVAFGEMIACDNEQCSIEWFHYSCVGLVKKPENEWLCKSCSQTKKVRL